MDEDDSQKTAIITPWGLFEYTVMPFGLRNACQTFQRYIDSVFRDLPYVFVYIDDILVSSENPEEHKQHLKEVFDRLKQHSLTININKCQFGKQEVNFLGYTINQNGFTPMKNQLDKIINYNTPENIMELRRFLGMINYYMRCIPQAAHMLLPLNNYTIIISITNSTSNPQH